jgi:hypothetical protein
MQECSVPGVTLISPHLHGISVQTKNWLELELGWFAHNADELISFYLREPLRDMAGKQAFGTQQIRSLGRFHSIVVIGSQREDRRFWPNAVTAWRRLKRTE